MKKVLLTGSSGFLGKHLYKYLKQNTDWEIDTPIINLVNPYTVYPLGGNYDYMINLASMSSVEASTKDPVGFIQTNTSIMLNVLEYARKYPPKVFLQMSTVEVYNVTNPYAASKAAQEEICNAYWKTYDIPIVIARSSNIIGEGQSPEKFVPKIIHQIKNGETVKLYTSDGKLGSRKYNPVNNVTDALLFLLKNYPYKQPLHKDFPVHFDITGGETLNNLTMAKKIAGILGRPLKYELIEPHQVRPTYAKSLVTHGTKLNKLGWRATQSLEDGLSFIEPLSP
jgi:dTDP-glucose 4,6-dehydratase